MSKESYLSGLPDDIIAEMRAAYEPIEGENVSHLTGAGESRVAPARMGPMGGWESSKSIPRMDQITKDGQHSVTPRPSIQPTAEAVVVVEIPALKGRPARHTNHSL